MVDKEDLLKQAEDIHSGLKRLSLKNRKVVMPHHKEFELIEYLNRIKTETLLSYGVYQVEADGLNLFEYIKGDKDSIMGLPIKQIIEYIKRLNL